MLYLLSSLALAQDCIAASQPAQISERLDQAEAAYIQLEIDLFSERLSEADLLIPCLDSLIDPQLAARLHRMRALQSYLSGEEAQLESSLRAARALDPGYTFPEAILPPGHALRDHYAAVDPAEVRDQRAPRPREGELIFDGTPSPLRPADRATLFQLAHPASPAAQSRYLYPEDPLPDYEINPRLRRSFLITGAALAAGAGGMYAASLSANRQFEADDPSYTLEDLETYQSRANRLFVVSLALGGAAAGAGATALWVGDR